MRRTTLCFAFLLVLCTSAMSQVLINEVVSGNATTIYGIDGRNDWIEIFNSGASAVSLNQWGLSDNTTDPYKWRFPDISIDPAEHLIVWAGGLNTPYVCNHWEMPIAQGDTWKYFVGTSEPPATWRHSFFDDSGWTDGVTPIGYGDGNAVTIIPATVSLYMRKTFTITDVSKIAMALLAIDYDDGYVAYLNNVEICRNNVDPDIPPFNETADVRHEGMIEQGGLPECHMINPQDIIAALHNGTNVLAVQIHNTDISSTDMIAIPYLAIGLKDANSYWNSPPTWFNKEIQLLTNFKIDASGETLTLTDAGGVVADQVNVPSLPVDYSYLRIPDGAASWNYSSVTTPSYTNSTLNYAAAITPEPVFSLAPGFYPGTVQVSISSSLSGANIYYTKSGNTPTTSDNLYSGPVSISSTTVLRARVISSGLMSGEVATGTYVINFNSTLPVVSLQTETANLWNAEKGIYVKGPYAAATFPYRGGNFWWSKRVKGHIEYFGKDHQRKFSMDNNLSIDGNYTRALPQKTFLVEAKTYYDSSTFNYQLFPDKPINKFKSFRLRNSGSDWMNTHFRDAITHRAVASLGQDIQDYNPVNLFLNGSYWGIGNIREIADEQYLAENRSVNPDSVDIIKVVGLDNFVPAGTQTAFYDMVDYVSSHSFSGSTGIQQMNTVWDLDNFTDWFILETYLVNDDWIGDWTNNIKLWRENKPNARWRMLFIDFDQGTTSAWKDKLYTGLHPADSNFYTYMMKKMLNNSTYKNYFINRYADIMNTTFQPAPMHALTNSFHDSIAPEMPRAIAKWGDSALSVHSMAQWDSVVNRMHNFWDWRLSYARDFVEAEFNLNGQKNVTLAVEPPNAGKIKISTIIPDSLPWTGVYFDGNPVTLTAIPNPGFTFNNWKPCATFSTANSNQSITYNISHNDSLIARFNGVATVAKISISEICYHPDSTRKSGDWIELHNYGTGSIDVSGWHVKDSSLINDFMIPTTTVIPAGGYLVLAEDTTKFHAVHPGVPVLGPTGIGLNNSSENISLFDNGNVLYLEVKYYDTIPWPMCADGLGTTLELKNDTLDPNLGSSWFDGCVGGSPGGPFVPCNYDIVFSELNYKSNVAIDGGDWVELHNVTGLPIDVSNWKLSDDNDAHGWAIPAATVIPANGYLVLVGDAAKFGAVYVWAGEWRGSFGFGFGSSRDAVRLYKPAGLLYNAMVYHAALPWPDAAGTGYTLEGIDSLWNKSEPGSWFLGCWGGSPGFPYHQPCDFGVEEIVTGSPMLVYPNPANDHFIVEFPSGTPDNAVLSLYDINGREVMNRVLTGSNSFSIPRANLNGGIYFLRVTAADGLYRTKTIVFAQ
ncbi:MAG: lamin tail domain-containing protein [Bacteroidota bacterium]